MRNTRKNRKSETVAQADQLAVDAKPVSSWISLKKPLKFLRGLTSNPDFAFQAMVVLLTLTAEDKKMDRRIDNMTSSIDALRGITDVLGGSMKSLREAAEAPRRIRGLLKPGDN